MGYYRENKSGQTSAVVKARLVVRGFEEDAEWIRSDSPTCSKESMRLVIAVASINGWECKSLDVKAAYLQGNRIDRDVFLQPPPEFSNGMLWKLNKTVYGLNDAARAWYFRVRDELDKLGLKRSSLDPALFFYHINGVFHGIICVYVDDFLWAGTEKFDREIIAQIKILFTIGSSESGSFKYVGLNIGQCPHGVSLDQFQYISCIRPIEVKNARVFSKSSELSAREKEQYRALVGQ